MVVTYFNVPREETQSSAEKIVQISARLRKHVGENRKRNSQYEAIIRPQR
jgi:hypothetical protein